MTIIDEKEATNDYLGAKWYDIPLTNRRRIRAVIPNSFNENDLVSVKDYVNFFGSSWIEFSRKHINNNSPHRKRIVPYSKRTRMLLGMSVTNRRLRR